MQGVASNHVVPSLSGVVVSRGYVPPYVSGGQPIYKSYNYGYVAPHYQGIPNYNILVHPFMCHAGVGYYPTVQGHGIYYIHNYMNQPFQGAWNQMAQPRLPFLDTLNFPNLSKLTNDPKYHDTMCPFVPSKIHTKFQSLKVILMRTLESM